MPRHEGSVSDTMCMGESDEGEADRIFELQEEVHQLKAAVASHAVVDQAIGMVVALGRVTPDQGWQVLKEVSQHTNIKLRNVADLILIWGRTGDMPPQIRAELEDYPRPAWTDTDSGHTARMKFNPPSAAFPQRMYTQQRPAHCRHRHPPAPTRNGGRGWGGRLTAQPQRGVRQAGWVITTLGVMCVSTAATV
jgi:hypothetical protein